jgi:hypothetical protein
MLNVLIQLKNVSLLIAGIKVCFHKSLSLAVSFEKVGERLQ